MKKRSPAQSPDLNPIEWVWSDLKQYVRKQYCSNQEELITAIHRFQQKLTPGYCQKYIKKLKEVENLTESTFCNRNLT